MKTPDMFSLARSVCKLVAYAIRHRTLSLTVDSKTQAERMAGCFTCDLFDPVSKQCGVCGCFVVAKTKFVTEDCPHPAEKRW